MRREQVFISTIASDAAETAREYGFGLEIAEFCTAWNMDEHLEETQKALKPVLDGIGNRTFHGPFNELFPCAIDPRARELAADRFRQAIKLAKDYGCRKLILHGGFNPWIYYPVWYTEQSVVFWKEFMASVPEDMEICLENVMETDPQMLTDIVKGVDDRRLKICLDIGHANVYSKTPVMEWIKACGPYISHFHIHNNDGTTDSHNPLNAPGMDIQGVLTHADHLCPNATFTMEILQSRESAEFITKLISA